jgi:glycine/D-amino acid oxidase-like deaminating enzyme
MMREPVVVLGAGLTGVCTALRIARLGLPVTIVDQAPRSLDRASVRNEGKIHLGFVYANDPSSRTANVMLDGALRFDRCVEEAIGQPVDWDDLRSTAFQYVVLEGSLCTPSELATFYESVQARYDDLAADGLTYLGARPRDLWRPLPEQAAAAWLAPGMGRASFATSELAIDTPKLCHLLRQVLAARDVESRFAHRVESAEARAGGYRISGRRTDGTPWSLDAPVVVNCLWEDRIRLDAQVGLEPARPWVHRLKYRLVGKIPPALTGLPSYTFVLGPFGDVVTWPSGRMYLSWYPTCMVGWSDDQQLPASWAGPRAGRVEPEVHDGILDGTLDALDRLLPGLAATDVDTLDACIITAWGATDVDDPESELHQRHDIGPHAHDGWISVDTGKFTTAPLYAQRAAAIAAEAAR